MYLHNRNKPKFRKLNLKWIKILTALALSILKVGLNE